MLGFKVAQATDAIYFAVRDYYAQARMKVLSELNSPGYEEIIENVYISEDFQDIKITLKDGLQTDRQDVFELLARGGTLLKTNGETVAVKPSQVIQNYLGKR